MSYSKKTLYGKTRKQFLKFAKITKKELLKALKTQKEVFKIEKFEKSYKIDLNSTNNHSYLISSNC